MPGVTATTAFGLLLRALAPLMGALVNDVHGVHCMVKLTALAAPAEILVLAQQMVPEVGDAGILILCCCREWWCSCGWVGGLVGGGRGLWLWMW
jgi:hypothetical protein